MNDLVIRARDLRKVYRLYSGPGYRFLDMFGLLGNRPGVYTEHAALEGVSLDIRRGEKVAIIGRNGAGKSTLLKLVTKVIEPTSGELEVQGQAHALLQIGTGFHPDFTGRENVYAYLAQLGVTGREADRRFSEIVEFAELEEYIGQPVKTYSTGMAVRLMFSTATAITPELLVLDEVLGVGDAYFAHKSFERMKTMCERQGTTLLLVTHDIYSAVKLCTRVVWIDRGRVLMDGDAPTVIKAYEDSVRQQEEQRLRTKKQERLKALEANRAANRARNLLLEIQGRNNEPQPSPVYFSAIALVDAQGAELARLPIDQAGSGTLEGSHLEFEGSCWGEAAVWEGRTARPLLNYGSPFHKVVGVFSVASPVVDPAEMSVRIEYWSERECQLVIRAFLDGKELALGSLPPVAGRWAVHHTRLDEGEGDALARAAEVSLTGRHGTGGIAILDVHTLNDAGDETHQFIHGEPFTLLVHYQINLPDLAERAQVLIAIHRDGILDTCRIWTRDLTFDAVSRPRGFIRLRLPRLYLANGMFTITVMIAQEGYYDRAQTKYFSLNPEVYTCLSRVTEIVVKDAGIVGSGTGVVGTGDWTLVDESAVPIGAGARAVGPGVANR